MASNQLIGYHPGHGFLYRLSGASKMLFFLLVSVAAMASYDTRFIVSLAALSLLLFTLAQIRWRDISFVIYIVLFMAIFNVIVVYLFAPQYGVSIYGQKTVIWSGIGAYNLTTQELFYLLNLLLKYFCTVPLAILFLMTTHPSQFAASLNRIGLPYKVAYSVSLTLRYIPDVQEEFQMIKLSQEARGLDLSKKVSLVKRIKGNLQIVVPLIFSSLERIDTIATAMELRRFGKFKKRSWYQHQDLAVRDYATLALAVFILALSLVLIAYNHGRFYNPWA